ncbi:hypothetical protein HDV01_002565 [Terramyces sp. JEL0728]|nr:hypothetical protein HDV01_002565 [Terramyces sp. JEL0728]
MILLADEQRTVERICDGQVLYSTAARLYESNGREYAHQYTGALALLNESSNFSFAMVDLKTARITWEFEIFGDIKYKQDKPFFHSFVGKNTLIGFSFADEDDAQEFCNYYRNRQKFIKPKSVSPTSTLVNHPIPVQEEKKKGGFFSFGKKEKKDKGKIDKSMISAPSDFQHVSHVGYNATSGFSVQNIPLEWKLIFQKAGITDEQLQDKKQLKVVKKFMKQNAGLVAAAAENPDPPVVKRTPPPPPPSRRQPPPPPPSRNTTVKIEKYERPASPTRYQPPVAVRPSLTPAPPTRPLIPVTPARPAIPDRTPIVPERATAVPERVPVIPIRAPVVPDRTPPSIPSRTPPSIPSRATPSIPERAPPMNYSAPVPPPPPMNNAIPPPPPMANSAPPLPASVSDRGGLLAQIRQGAQLKQATTTPAPVAQAPQASTGDIAALLRDAINKHRDDMNASGNSILTLDTDSDDDDDW